MNEVAYGAAAALAAVFVWAGAGKLARPDAALEGLRAMGISRPRLVARGLPVAELTVAVALLAVPVVGAILALATLGAFSAVLASRVRAGTTAPCACFGSAGSHPVSFVELVRNGLLSILALAALLAGEPVWPSLPAATIVAGALVCGVLVLALCRLYADVGMVWSNRLAREAVTR